MGLNWCKQNKSQFRAITPIRISLLFILGKEPLHVYRHIM